VIKLINVMDRATQDNAAMVQQTTEANRGAGEAESLNALLAQFVLEQRNRPSHVKHARHAAA